MAIKQYGYPYWKHCNYLGNKFGWFDPPGAVPTVAGILPTLSTTTAADPIAADTGLEATPSAATSMPSVTRASVVTKPAEATSDVQKRPNADKGTVDIEETPALSAPSPSKGPENKEPDGNANSDAPVVLESEFQSDIKSGLAASPTKQNSEDARPTATSAITVTHENDDSNPENQSAIKAQDEKSQASAIAIAIAQNDNSDPKDQPVITKLLITTTPTTRPSGKVEQTAGSAGVAVQKDNDDDSDSGDDSVTKVQQDDDDDTDSDGDKSDTSDGAARILASIFHGIPHTRRPTGSAATVVPNDRHSPTSSPDIDSESFDNPIADAVEDSSDRPGSRISATSPSESVGKTDGDDDGRQLAVQSAPAGVAAASSVSSSEVSGSPVFADGESPDESTHDVTADDSSHHLSTEKTDPSPVEMMIKGHAGSVGKEAQHADADVTGNDDDASSTSVEQNGGGSDKVGHHSASGTAAPEESPTTSESSNSSASGVVVVDGSRVTAGPTAAGQFDKPPDATEVEVVGTNEFSSVDRHSDDPDKTSSIIATGEPHDQADRVDGAAFTDTRSDSSSSTTAAAAAAADSDSAELDSTASFTKNGDAASTTALTPSAPSVHQQYFHQLFHL
jgi:hypothetical protein